MELSLIANVGVYDRALSQEEVLMIARGINWKDRHEKTLDAMMNNLMFWLFLIYPASSLAVLEVFSCNPIYDRNYLIASMNEEDCPWRSHPWYDDKMQMHTDVQMSHLGWVAFCFIFVYPVGVPLVMYFIIGYTR